MVQRRQTDHLALPGDSNQSHIQTVSTEMSGVSGMLQIEVPISNYLQ